MFNIGDLDIDCKNRNDILSKIKYVSASKINNNKIIPHNTGIYVCDVPKDLITGLCSIDYKEAEEKFGFIKIDLLHNTFLDKITSRDELKKLALTEPNWELLYNEECFKTLPQIYNYYNELKLLPKISNLEEMAMFLAIIRPGKSYCLEIVKKSKSWESIKDEVWKIIDNSKYQYKKSQAFAYALLIISSLNFYELNHQSNND